jgi:hypothetical protein
MVLGLCWILCCVLVGKYARTKGRNGIGFFFIALFLTPLAGFLMALVTTPNWEKSLDRAGLKKCCECAEYVRQDARLCRFCRHSFDKNGPDCV